MKITFQKSTLKNPNPYRNRTTGNLGFRYIVSGTSEELTKYKSIQGDFYRETETKEPLFFSKRLIGIKAEMNLNQDGTKFYPDTTELDMYANLEEQWGATIANQKMAELKAA